MKRAVVWVFKILGVAIAGVVVLFVVIGIGLAVGVIATPQRKPPPEEAGPLKQEAAGVPPAEPRPIPTPTEAPRPAPDAAPVAEELSESGLTLEDLARAKRVVDSVDELRKATVRTMPSPRDSDLVTCGKLMRKLIPAAQAALDGDKELPLSVRLMTSSASVPLQECVTCAVEAEQGCRKLGAVLTTTRIFIAKLEVKAKDRNRVGDDYDSLTPIKHEVATEMEDAFARLRGPKARCAGALNVLTAYEQALESSGIKKWKAIEVTECLGVR